MAKRSRPRASGLSRALGMIPGRRSGGKPRASSKALAAVSLSDLRRASPAENVRMGFTPKARRYVKASAKVTKATASISARKAETKRTQARYGFKSPEAATKARKAGALSYESQAQAGRVRKAAGTRAAVKELGRKAANGDKVKIRLRNSRKNRFTTISFNNATAEKYKKTRRAENGRQGHSEPFRMARFSEDG